MAMLGTATLAMWWNMAAAVRPEFEQWHTHEHFRERLGIPGFRRASRWTAADGGEGIFVMYELESYATLSSEGYLARLNAPTPWSTRMMPHHRDMVRSQCRVLHSHGAVAARQAVTVRLSPEQGQDAQALRAALAGLGAEFADRPGLVGAHLLQHQTPAIAPTTEQRIRGGDAVADWVFVVTGYDPAVVKALLGSELSEASLMRIGAAAGSVAGIYQLSIAAIPGDVP